MSNTTYKTDSEAQTKAMAADFARTLKGGEVVFLIGDLGSGKTTFVRGVAEACGFTQPVRSPSFTIVNRYPVQHGPIKQILHVDFYRIEDDSEIAPLALEEELGHSNTVAFIEWPERGGKKFQQATQTIRFSTQGTQHLIKMV